MNDNVNRPVVPANSNSKIPTSKIGKIIYYSLIAILIIAFFYFASRPRPIIGGRKQVETPQSSVPAEPTKPVTKLSVPAEPVTKVEPSATPLNEKDKTDVKQAVDSMLKADKASHLNEYSKIQIKEVTILNLDEAEKFIDELDHNWRTGHLLYVFPEDVKNDLIKINKKNQNKKIAFIIIDFFFHKGETISSNQALTNLMIFEKIDGSWKENKEYHWQLR